ncbi:MAG: hemerythrin domain-containing protein [Thermoplasmata archaeon]|nr:hemerythrin domain-containing protein [Thermoplasmata archaeon]
MPDFKIDPSLSVGEDKIDEQHAKLLDQIDEIEKIISTFNVEIGSLRRANQFLFTYVKEHLAYEEEYMEKNKYPGLENHKKTHKKFIGFLQDFQIEFKEKYTSNDFSSIDITALLKRIREYLKLWVNHIKITDQKYAKWINNHKSH